MKTYRVVESAYCAHLEREVNELLVRGWLPVGGVSVVYKLRTFGPDYAWYAQAMIKESPKP